MEDDAVVEADREVMLESSGEWNRQWQGKNLEGPNTPLNW